MEKPIIFSTPMIEAILDGRKNQTRRVIKPQQMEFADGTAEQFNSIEHYKDDDFIFKCRNFTTFHASPYKVGQILWVRETWCRGKARNGDNKVIYKADVETDLQSIHNWKPSIHMPKEAARIFLKVTNVRVERLQDITEEDAFKEGCIDYQCKIGDGKFEDVIEFDLTARDAFIDLWDSLNAKRGYSWESNPWVWAIEFEKI